MILGIFEDEKVGNFYPLTYTRPVYELRTGLYTLRERVLSSLSAQECHLYMRAYLSKAYLAETRCKVNELPHDDDILLVNGRLLFDARAAELVRRALKAAGDVAFLKDGDLVVAKLGPRSLEGILGPHTGWTVSKESLTSLKEVALTLEGSSVTLLEYPWQLIARNKELLKEDYIASGLKGELEGKVSLYGERRWISVGEGSRVEDFTVLDARRGPIVMGKGVEIQSGTRIEGPTYIGDGSVVVGGSLIRAGSNIGPGCRIGGEVKNSIVHGNSNKAHEGFLGEAYVGEWVNLGALTTNSDLKNTYGSVKMYVGGRKMDTGLKKLGCLIGDMAKTSIGTLIYTGKKIGVASHLYGVVAEDVASFVIYAKSVNGKVVELEVDEAIKIQRRTCKSRGRELRPEEEELIRTVYELTRAERKGVPQERFKLP